MTITVVQSGGTLTDNATNGSRVFASNVTSGNKLVLMAFRYADTDSTDYTAGDLTKTAGTSTVANIARQAFAHINYQTTFYIGCAVWTADVTGTGSLTVQAAGAASNYHGVIGVELNASNGWDAGFVEDTAQNETASDNTNASSGNADSAGAAIFLGVLATSNNGGTVTITPDAAFTQILESQDEDTHAAGSTMYRIVTGATTDSFDWTISNNLGWTVAGVVLKEVAAAGDANARLIGGDLLHSNLFGRLVS